MTKKKRTPQLEPVCSDQGTTVYRHNRGIVKDNAVRALLHDRLFRQRIERKRKGKGSYQRKAKHSGAYFEKPDYQVSAFRDLIIGLFIKDCKRYRGNNVS